MRAGGGARRKLRLCLLSRHRHRALRVKDAARRARRAHLACALCRHRDARRRKRREDNHVTQRPDGGAPRAALPDAHAEVFVHNVRGLVGGARDEGHTGELRRDPARGDQAPREDC